MTTAQPPTGPETRPAVVGPVVRAAFLVTLLVGLAAVAAGALSGGAAAALGAGIGTAVVCVFFAAGAVVLNAVSALVPSASLLVALLTYTLKVTLLAVVFLALSRSGALEGAVDAGWLGGTVIACTMAWLVSQIFFHVRVRQPLYDLPSARPEASAR
jgi:ATP synthase protein I